MTRLLIVAIVSFPAMAQQMDSLPPVPSVPVALSFFAPILVPIKIVQDEAALRDFLVGPAFTSYRRERGDVPAVDLLFRHALDICWGNTGEAALICMLATFEHRTLGIRIPVLGLVLWLPLTGEYRDEFERRVRVLPSLLYGDTPPEGDRDKLQHFFGSAFLTLLFDSPEAADNVGQFIEIEEDALIEGGVNDVRDVRANKEGQRFGVALLSHHEALPSEFLGK